MSSRKRSPNATCVIPSAPARAIAAFIAASYSALLQGQGIGTGQSGNSAASACARRSSVRTACIATRSNASLIVVSSPTTSTSACSRRTCSDQALSLPLLQARRAFGFMLTRAS